MSLKWCALVLLLPVLWADPLLAHCAPADVDRDRLRELAGAGWVLDEAPRQALALQLLACLDDPDPQLRDALALEALAQWARADALTTDTLSTMSGALQARLRQPDPAGVGHPFAVLALAEVARADRIKPFLAVSERAALVATAAGYLSGVSDYRGFDERDGWRHGVAHGADLAMQLSLNPALTRAQLDGLLDAVATQAVPAAAHFYVYGEGERLARPVLFIAQRGLHAPETWTSWFEQLLLRATPPEGAPLTQVWLARRHNLKALIWPLYGSVATTQNEAIKTALWPGLEAVIRKLP